MAVMTIKYGERDEYEVEFRVNDKGELEGRYAHSSYAGGYSTWEVREPQPENAELIAAITNALGWYAWPASS